MDNCLISIESFNPYKYLLGLSISALYKQNFYTSTCMLLILTTKRELRTWEIDSNCFTKFNSYMHTHIHIYIHTLIYTCMHIHFHYFMRWWVKNLFYIWHISLMHNRKVIISFIHLLIMPKSLQYSCHKIVVCAILLLCLHFHIIHDVKVILFDQIYISNLLP